MQPIAQEHECCSDIRRETNFEAAKSRNEPAKRSEQVGGVDDLESAARRARRLLRVVGSGTRLPSPGCKRTISALSDGAVAAPAVETLIVLASITGAASGAAPSPSQIVRGPSLFSART